MTKQRIRTLGRPPQSAERKEKDRLIGLTVFKLMYWARGNQTEVCEAVGKAAQSVLTVTDPDSRALGGDRIKQMYKNWRREENRLRDARGWPPLPQPKDYIRETLRGSAPFAQGQSIEALAEQLFNNKGSLPIESDSFLLNSLPRPEKAPRARGQYRRGIYDGPFARPEDLVDPKDLPPGAIVFESPDFKSQSNQINRLLRLRKRSRVKK